MANMDSVGKALIKYRNGKITLVGAAKLANMDTHEFLYYINEHTKELAFSRN